MELGEVVVAGPPDKVRADPKALAAYLGASDEALMASGPLADAGGGRTGGDPDGGDRRGRDEGA